jgi:transcriptional regulator with XRE-family HTH domain
MLARVAAGLTSYQLADLVGCDRSSITKWEINRWPANVKRVAILMAAIERGKALR